MKNSKDKYVFNSFTIVFLRLVLFILVLLLPGCGDVGYSGQYEETSNIQTISTLNVCSDGESEYVIVRQGVQSEELRNSIQLLVSSFRDNFGVTLKVRDDFVNDISEIPVSQKEILVGTTNRLESTRAAVDNKLRVDDFVISGSAESERIVILGGSDSATVAATEYFISNFLNKKSEIQRGSFEFNCSEVFVHRGEYEVSLIKINSFDIYDFKTVLSDNADRDEIYAVELIKKAVEKKTGIKLETVTNENLGNSPAIFFCNDKNVAEKDVSSLMPGSLIICGEKGNIVAAAREFSEKYILNAHCEATLTVEPLQLAVSKTEEYPDDPQGIVGGSRIALADQKNSQCVVVDADSGPNAEVLWSYSPIANGNRIDECRLRFSEKLGTYVVGITSSSGYFAVVEYPSKMIVFSGTAAGYGPHSIEYLPSGAIAIACSGNGDNTKAGIRFYPSDSTGKIGGRHDFIRLEGAHGVLWDNERELLWVLGTNVLKAFEIVSEGLEAKLCEVGIYRTDITWGGGHDLSAVANDNALLWVGGVGAYKVSKSTGEAKEFYIASGVRNLKCIDSFSDGRIIRTVAANVFASHDTDKFTLYEENGKYISETVFANRAFYKARVFDPHYSREN